MQTEQGARHTPLILAPMAGYTDKTFRTLCKEQGCDVTVTEMVSAKGFSYENEKTRALLDTAAVERPVVMQLFGRDPALLAETARRIEGEYDGCVHGIDLNMGCPARKITGNGEGSALMREPVLAGRIVAAMAGAVSLPVSVKLRKGYDAAHENAVEIARIAEENGAAAVTVHPRTREQMYAGRADWTVIADVKAKLHIPVIGNGDVTNGDSALAMLRETGCDGLMIGRGALGNPWVFREIRAALSDESYVPPTARERIETALRHARLAQADKGRQGVLEMRKHMACYLRGLPGASQLRVKLQSCMSAEEMAQILLDTCAFHSYN